MSQQTPNAKVPVITDAEGPNGAPITIFESAAILTYLAEKTGLNWPSEPSAQYEALQWMYWQMAGLGPNLGQLHHFNRVAPESET